MKSKLLSGGLFIVMLVSLWFFVFSLGHKFIYVSGTSMEPTIKDGSLAVATQADVIDNDGIYLIRIPDDDNILAVKRLIGIPGDTIELIDGATYRNGELIEEAPDNSFDNFTFILKDDEYLFLGDNRRDSMDARYWSRPLRKDEILYQLDAIVLPKSQRTDLR